MKKIIITVAAGALCLPAFGAPKRASVVSPDGRISMTLTQEKTGIFYQVDVDGTSVIAKSRLGFDSPQITPGRKAKMTTTKASKDEVWTQPWGENKTLVDHHNETAVTFTEPDLKLTVRMRAFNDGVGFRYEWETSRTDSVTIMEELTEFNFAAPATTWSIPADFDSYEKEYRVLPAENVENANTPFTFRMDGGLYGSIHEAALYNFPEMTLRHTAGTVRGFNASLAPMPDGVKAVTPGKFATPWRTLQIGAKPTDLINSAMILNLNEPCKIEDTSWIKPQKYVGIWWGMHLGTQVWTMGPRHGATTENAIKYIDFAKANNLQGVLFEGWNEGWENWGGNQHFDYIKAYPDFDIDRIAAYAREKGIELWAHNETGGNIPEYEAVLDSAYRYYQSLGIHTVKTGYAGGFKGGYYHHSQYGVRHYQNVVETAARYRLMLDAHEPIKETGIRRTWPNMMTREGARGMEWNAWSEGNSATYLCTLPFVRLLSGPMDYTPGIFDINYERAKADPGRIEWNGPNGHCHIKTTIARQIANWVIIYSPLQMAADQIENYEGHPGFQFFRDFNADCDWSEALQGEIGKYILVARRAGDDFFVGAGTDSEARTLSMPLDFLKSRLDYEAVIYGDDMEGGRPDELKITKKRVRKGDTLTIEMLPTGGQAITFKPVKVK